MQKVIVTGANGFIGSNLCRHLIKKNIYVYAVIRDAEMKDMDLNASELIRVIKCDMEDLLSLAGLIDDKVDIFYHLAWNGVSGKKRGDYELQVNSLKWSLDAVKVAQKLGCKRFVGVGSTAENDVYCYASQDESTPNLVSLYGASKIASRLMTKAECNSIDIDHLWATIGNTYGEDDNSTNFINFAYEQIVSANPARFTAGEQMYDFVNVVDVADALVCIGLNGKKNKNYYIGSGKPDKLKNFIIKLRDIVNPRKELELGAIPFNGVCPNIELFDCQKLMDDTGYYPKVSFEEGIKRIQKSRIGKFK